MADFPCIFDEAQISERIDPNKVLENLRIAFRGLVSGTSIQPQEVVTELPEQKGDCVFYTGLVSDLGAFGVAASPFLNDRERQGMSPVTSYTLLLSTETGLPLIICDSKYLTKVRTAATTMLAVSALRNGNERTLTIVGAGEIGIEHAKQAQALDIFERITVVSPSLCDRVSARYQERLDIVSRIGEIVVPGTNIEESVSASDVVMLCTDSGVPVVKNEWLLDAKLVTSLTTNAPGAHEVDPTFLEISEVFCDYRKTCPDVAGEMVLATSQQIWTPDAIIADLPELMCDGSLLKGNLKKPRYFRSVGLGIEDIAAAYALL